MSFHRYVLEPYNSKSKIDCPSCKEKKVFTRYIDSETKSYIHSSVGICDRALKCGYHLSPREFFARGGKQTDHFKTVNINQVRSSNKIDFIPKGFLDKSLNPLFKNNFIEWLHKCFNATVANNIRTNFFVGTSKHWLNSTVFWQVDLNGNVRQAKIMLYDVYTVKRIKRGAMVKKWDSKKACFVEQKTNVDCTKVNGKYLSKDTINLNLVQCFYNEHQLSVHKKKDVAIVESEKTAIIASIFFEDYVWLATGGKNGCKWTDKSVCQVLQGRNVILFPDLGAGCYDLWRLKAAEIRSIVRCRIHVSDLLEKNASAEHRANGCDLADFLLAQQMK